MSIRVDTVHQGHRDGQPGLYHINAVDTVTQWQVVGCVETIAERHLLPVLEAMLHQFPFRIRGFHCDNGSEFINHTVARLLEKLRVEFTKSRAYRTTDNALVEGKNGAVVRKQIGYGPIDAEHAEAFQKFYTKHFNLYLNYDRPCGFAQIKTLARGRRRRVYPAEDHRTPFEKLSSLPNWEKHLKPGVTASSLERMARQLSDTEAARRMQKAKQMLWTPALAVSNRCGVFLRALPSQRARPSASRFRAVPSSVATLPPLPKSFAQRPIALATPLSPARPRRVLINNTPIPTRGKKRMSTSNKIDWPKLLVEAATKPGEISEAYRRFHGYSLANKLWAMTQCNARGIAPGPLASFQWVEGSRQQMKKGERAICLCMPLSVKRKEKGENDNQMEASYQIFVQKNNWFVLSQTEGREYTPEPLPEWNEARALEVLNITKVPFDLVEGNVQGYAAPGQA